MKVRPMNVTSWAVGAFLALSMGGCQAKDEAPGVPTPPVVGTWIRVFPTEGALDTLVIHADGTLTGGDAVFDSAGFAYTHWQIGCTNSPEALGVGEAPVGKDRPLGTKRRLWCHPFWIIGDTLLLADTKNTAFLRAPAREGGVAVTAWEKPRGIFAVPEMGESMRVAPPKANP